MPYVEPDWTYKAVSGGFTNSGGPVVHHGEWPGDDQKRLLWSGDVRRGIADSMPPTFDRVAGPQTPQATSPVITWTPQIVSKDRSHLIVIEQWSIERAPEGFFYFGKDEDKVTDQFAIVNAPSMVVPIIATAEGTFGTEPTGQWTGSYYVPRPETPDDYINTVRKTYCNEWTAVRALTDESERIPTVADGTPGASGAWATDDLRFPMWARFYIPPIVSSVQALIIGGYTGLGTGTERPPPLYVPREVHVNVWQLLDTEHTPTPVTPPPPLQPVPSVTGNQGVIPRAAVSRGRRFGAL